MHQCGPHQYAFLRFESETHESLRIRFLSFVFFWRGPGLFNAKHQRLSGYSLSSRPVLTRVHRHKDNENTFGLVWSLKYTGLV